MGETSVSSYRFAVCPILEAANLYFDEEPLNPVLFTSEEEASQWLILDPEAPPRFSAKREAKRIGVTLEEVRAAHSQERRRLREAEKIIRKFEDGKPGRKSRMGGLVPEALAQPPDVMRTLRRRRGGDRKPGWLGPVPIMNLGAFTGPRFNGKTLEREFPPDTVTDVRSSQSVAAAGDEKLDEIFEGVTGNADGGNEEVSESGIQATHVRNVTCMLGDDWNFDNLATFSQRPLRGEKIKDASSFLLGEMHRLEESLFRHQRNLPASAVPVFWRSWQVHFLLARICSRVAKFQADWTRVEAARDCVATRLFTYADCLLVSPPAAYLEAANQSASESAPGVSEASAPAKKHAGTTAHEAQESKERRKHKKPPRRNQRYKVIDQALQEIAGGLPSTQEDILRSLDERRVLTPPAEPFMTARGWTLGFRRDAAAARSWLSKRWAELNLPSLPRGPKK